MKEGPYQPYEHASNRQKLPKNGCKRSRLCKQCTRLGHWYLCRPSIWEPCSGRLLPGRICPLLIRVPELRLLVERTTSAVTGSDVILRDSQMAHFGVARWSGTSTIRKTASFPAAGRCHGALHAGLMIGSREPNGVGFDWL